MTSLPALTLRHIYRLDADLDAPIDLGHAPQGHRRILALTRYTLETDDGQCCTSGRTAYATASRTCSRAWPPARTSTPLSTRSAPR
jgi:hypothetical protein